MYHQEIQNPKFSKLQIILLLNLQIISKSQHRNLDSQPFQANKNWTLLWQPGIISIRDQVLK